MRCRWIVVGLVGCAGAGTLEVDPVQPEPDTGAPVVDPDPDPDDCGLDAPMAIASADDAVIAAWMSFVDIEAYTGLVQVVVNDAADGACPEIVTWDNGGRIDAGDGCTTETGWDIAGVAEFVSLSDDLFTLTFEDFSLATVQDAGEGRVEVDGSLQYAVTSAGTTVSLDVVEQRWLSGSFGAGLPNGRFERRLEVIGEAESSLSLAGYVRVFEADLSTAGDFCVALEIEENPTCDIEEDGFIEIVGASTALITLDGDGSCDGCLGVAIDGQSVDPYCD